MLKPYTKPDRLYTGVGNRDAPPAALWLGFQLAQVLYTLGYTGRGGGAPGMDRTFYLGGGKRFETYPPWDRFEGFNMQYAIPKGAFKMAEEILTPEVFNHPKRGRGYKFLHARNMQEVLGPHVEPADKSDFLIAYTRDGCTGKDTRRPDTGGTASAILCAEMHNVGVINLYHDSWAEDLGVYTGHDFFPLQAEFYERYKGFA